MPRTLFLVLLLSPIFTGSTIAVRVPADSLVKGQSSLRPGSAASQPVQSETNDQAFLKLVSQQSALLSSFLLCRPAARSALSGGAGCCTSFVGAGTLFTCVPAEKDWDVIVVGGGIAGLTAARNLLRQASAC